MDFNCLSLTCNKVEHFSPHPGSFVLVYACVPSDPFLMFSCSAWQRGSPLWAPMSAGFWPNLANSVPPTVEDTWRQESEARDFSPPFFTLGFACCRCDLSYSQTCPQRFQLSLDNVAFWGPRTFSPTFVGPAEGMRVVSHIVLTIPFASQLLHHLYN